MSANKKGFSGRKAVAGAILAGAIGLFARTLGSNKLIITCLSCGHKFRPGEGMIKNLSGIQISQEETNASRDNKEIYTRPTYATVRDQEIRDRRIGCLASVAILIVFGIIFDRLGCFSEDKSKMMMPSAINAYCLMKVL
ncbi:MAG TPA: hypothetical protein VK787_05080 [Puia sp.]|nr:hypothetical protein [Puia sp.]